MKRRILIGCILIITTTIVRAGDFNVVGNMNVASNLTAGVVTLRGATDLADPVLDFSQPGLFYRYTLTNNPTWVFTNHVAGLEVWLQIAQDTTGGWHNTWPVDLLWPAGGAANGSAGPEYFSVFKILDNGTHWLAQVEGLNYRVPCTANCNYALHPASANWSAFATADASPDFTPTGAVTIEFWLQHSGDPAFVTHCASNSDYTGWAIQVGNSSLLFRRQAYGGISYWEFSETDAGWHHYAITFDGEAFAFYLDGGHVGDDTGTFVADSGAPLYIAWPGDTTAYDIDEYRLSSVARYTDTFTPACNWTVDANTVAYWKFNEGSGSTLADSSNLGHAGTLHGTPLPSWMDGTTCVAGQTYAPGQSLMMALSNSLGSATSQSATGTSGQVQSAQP